MTRGRIAYGGTYLHVHYAIAASQVKINRDGLKELLSAFTVWNCALLHSDRRAYIMDLSVSRVINVSLIGDLSCVLPKMSQFFHDPFTEHRYIFSGKVVRNSAVKQYTPVGSKLIMTKP
jgi:hypothetical protein